MLIGLSMKVIKRTLKRGNGLNHKYHLNLSLLLRQDFEFHEEWILPPGDSFCVSLKSL